MQQKKSIYSLCPLYFFHSTPSFTSIALFYSTTFPSVSTSSLFFIILYHIYKEHHSVTGINHFVPVTLWCSIAKYMYNKINKFKEGCNYMNLKKAKLFICTLLLTMTFVSASSVSASETPPTDTSTEENAPETESSEEIFHLPAILFFHYSKKQGFICRKDSKTVKTVVIILRKQK